MNARATQGEDNVSESEVDVLFLLRAAVCISLSPFRDAWHLRLSAWIDSSARFPCVRLSRHFATIRLPLTARPFVAIRRTPSFRPTINNELDCLEVTLTCPLPRGEFRVLLVFRKLSRHSIFKNWDETEKSRGRGENLQWLFVLPEISPTGFESVHLSSLRKRCKGYTTFQRKADVGLGTKGVTETPRSCSPV